MYPSSQERNLPLHFQATNLGRTITQIGLVLFTLIGMVLVFSTSHANETQVEVVDSWVEDGFLFHVAFETEPSNANCALNGEGLIAFEVAYDAYAIDGVHSVFGVAIWYPGAESDDWVKTQGQAQGPQSSCGKSNPCHIQAVHVVQTYCPATDGPLYSWPDELSDHSLY